MKGAAMPSHEPLVTSVRPWLGVLSAIAFLGTGAGLAFVVIRTYTRDGEETLAIGRNDSLAFGLACLLLVVSALFAAVAIQLLGARSSTSVPESDASDLMAAWLKDHRGIVALGREIASDDGMLSTVLVFRRDLARERAISSTQRLRALELSDQSIRDAVTKAMKVMKGRALTLAETEALRSSIVGESGSDRVKVMDLLRDIESALSEADLLTRLSTQ
jgi:hypothetical protein